MSTAHADEDIDLLRYGRFLASYWKVLAAAAFAGALAGLAVSAALPARFQATATLALVQPAGVTPVVLTPATAKALFTSQTILAETVKEAGLEMTPQAFRDDALDVQTMPGSSIISLQVTLEDPAKARLAAQLLATKGLELTRRMDRESGISTRDTLKKQLTEAARNLERTRELFIEAQVRADLEGLAARIEAARRQRLPTDDLRSELYLRRIDIERLHTEYLDRARIHRDLAQRSADADKTSVDAPRLQIVDAPIQPDRPLPRRRVQFALFGAVLGAIAGVCVSLALNRRRLERRVLV
jgi:uncharacterized protein involved in exopolysaccharide biosynthesis